LAYLADDPTFQLVPWVISYDQNLIIIFSEILYPTIFEEVRLNQNLITYWMTKSFD
jgi:hypothetical protein